MSASSSLFNLSDMPLLLMSSLCLVFAFMETRLPGQSRLEKTLLIGLLISVALSPASKILFFDTNRPPWDIGDAYEYLVLTSLIRLIEPVFLLLYTGAYLNRQSKSFVPTWINITSIIFLSISIVAIFSIVDSSREQLFPIEWFPLFQSKAQTVLGVVHLFTLSILALTWISAYHRRSAKLENNSATKKEHENWLKAVLWLFSARIALLSAYYLIDFIFPSGTLTTTVNGLNNYLQFSVVCALAWSRFVYLPLIDDESHLIDHEEIIEPEEKLLQEHGESLEKYMKDKKPYLKPGLSLKNLSQQLEWSSRTLSKTINRQFGVNFHEYINKYRIEEAKELLRNKGRDSKKITEIYLDVGFNNRSVFNKVFRDSTGQTPSGYRKQHFELFESKKYAPPEIDTSYTEHT